MAKIDNTLLDELINQVLQNAGAPSITGPLVVSLHIGSPGSTRANEVSTGVWTNYARQTIARSGVGFTGAADNGAGGRFGGNAAAVDFGTATIVGGNGTNNQITHFEVWDSAGSPRRIGGDALVASKVINNGDPVKFTAAGDLSFHLTG